MKNSFENFGTVKVTFLNYFINKKCLEMFNILLTVFIDETKMSQVILLMCKCTSRTLV